MQPEKFTEAEQVYTDALKIFKKLADENSKSYLFDVANIQINLGNLYLIMRNLEKADNILKKAIKIDPANVEILYNIACLESLRDNQAKADPPGLHRPLSLVQNRPRTRAADTRFASDRSQDAGGGAENSGGPHGCRGRHKCADRGRGGAKIGRRGDHSRQRRRYFPQRAGRNYHRPVFKELRRQQARFHCP